ncbi:MAG: hypothetical protein IJE05_01070 [Clostridia bacterium]|nr:hypothetical protein [Clostridia bacterium]
MTKKLSRRLDVESKRTGKLTFKLMDEDSNCIGTVVATPYKVMLVEAANPNVMLTPEERIFCQMSAKKTLRGFY